MVSVIIPTLNEGPTIASVVRFALADPLVTDVLVIDDASTDDTVAEAEAAGARVMQSTLLGKGASMEDGLLWAECECIVFLDGDLQGLQSGLISKLAEPILQGRADMVKGSFTRSGGRVTTLTAKPLLQVFFPELAGVAQPLGGIFAASRELLASLHFEPDYGVDVGLLIDACIAGAKLEQVEIGHIQHDSQSLESLGRMARQVARVILDRAQQHGRMDAETLAEIREVERQMHAGLEAQSHRHMDPRPIVLLPVDDLVLDGQMASQLAIEVGRAEAAEELSSLDSHDPLQLERKFALFHGVAQRSIEDASRRLPLREGIVESVRLLRKRGYRVAIVGDVLYASVEILRRRIYAHMGFAHMSQRFGRDASTGEVIVMPEFRHRKGCRMHELCSGNVVCNLREHYGLRKRQISALGVAGRHDCLLELAGQGVAVDSTDCLIKASAAIADAEASLSSSAS